MSLQGSRAKEKTLFYLSAWKIGLPYFLPIVTSSGRMFIPVAVGLALTAVNL
jgi:hypothetical protein